MKPDPGYLRSHADGCSLSVRVQPGAKKTAILGVYGDGEHAALKIAVQAPPVDGRANEALVAFLSELFSLSLSAVTIAYGQTGRSKAVVLRGLPLAQALDRIQSQL